MKITKKMILTDEATLEISRIQKNTAIKILAEYLFPGKIWKEKKQVGDQLYEFGNIPSYAEKTDLTYNLCPSSSDEMYFTMSDKPGKGTMLTNHLPPDPEELEELSTAEIKERTKKHRNKKQPPSASGKTGTRTYDMKPEFISRLEHRGVKILFIPQTYIKESIEMLVPELEAIIKNSIFPDQKLKTLGKGLGKYERKITEMEPRTKERKLKKALEALIIAYQNREVEFYERYMKSGDSSNVK